jgi:hypothetical protein
LLYSHFFIDIPSAIGHFAAFLFGSGSCFPAEAPETGYFFMLAEKYS